MVYGRRLVWQVVVLVGDWNCRLSLGIFGMVVYSRRLGVFDCVGEVRDRGGSRRGVH